jgi:hypothetical protein
MQSVNVKGSHHLLLQGKTKQETSMKQAVSTAVICNIQISCLAYSSALKMEAIHSSRISSPLYSTQNDSLEDQYLQKCKHPCLMMMMKQNVSTGLSTTFLMKRQCAFLALQKLATNLTGSL